MANNKRTKPGGRTAVPTNVAHILGELHRLATMPVVKSRRSEPRLLIRGK